MRDEEGKPSGYLLKIGDKKGTRVVVTCSAEDHQVGVHGNEREASKYIRPILPASRAALDAAIQNILTCDEVVASIQSPLGPLSIKVLKKSLEGFSVQQEVFYLYIPGQPNALNSFGRLEDAQAEANRLAKLADQKHEEEFGVASSQSAGPTIRDDAAGEVARVKLPRSGKSGGS